jgi:uncharacterized protein (UPF0335 family)
MPITVKGKKDETAKAGHNSVAHDLLKEYVSRIENLNDEIAGLSDDRREIFAEAKGRGLDTKALRKLIARRKLDAQEREEQDAVLALYEGVFA